MSGLDRYAMLMAKPHKAPRAKPVQRERSLQTQIVLALRQAFPETFFAAIPNGGKRNAIEAALMKKAGGVAGIPDLMVIPVKGGVGFIEIKQGKIVASSMSQGQKDFRNLCEAHGVQWAIVNSIDDAMDAVLRMKGLRV